MQISYSSLVENYKAYLLQFQGLVQIVGLKFVDEKIDALKNTL